MPTIAQEFATMADEFVDAFSGGGNGTLSRSMGGTFSAVTGTEDFDTTYTLSIAYVRHGDARIEERFTAGGGKVKVEVIEYYIKSADLSGASWDTGANAIPRIDDGFTEASSPYGDGKKRRIVEVRPQQMGAGYKLRTETLLTQ